MSETTKLETAPVSSLLSKGELMDFNSLYTLRDIVRLSNDLAKRLAGGNRETAYQIKAQACSLLILSGWARPNGLRPGCVIGLEVSGDPAARFHIVLAHLSPEARKVLEQENLPRVSSLADRLDPRSADLLRNLSKDHPPKTEAFAK